jgi:hypothetical protein
VAYFVPRKQIVAPDHVFHLLNHVLVGPKCYLVTTSNGVSVASRISKNVADMLIAGGMNHGS